MATKIIGKIVLYEPLSQDEIDAAIAGPDLVVFEIERRFQLTNIPQNLAAVVPTSFDVSYVDYVEAMKLFLDAASFVHLENAFVWKIYYDVTDKEFNLKNSYQRTETNSSKISQTIVSDGQLLNAVFITPGLEGTIETVVALPFEEPISTTDLEALEAVGIELNSGATGSLFSVNSQKVPYKVIFFQPDTVTTENYVIDFNLQNKIINL
jgi:hypothetical protein